MTHNKISFVREYCLARRIPYKIKGEQLYIAGKFCCFSIYNLTYKDLIDAIDKVCEYDVLSTHFVRYVGD